MFGRYSIADPQATRSPGEPRTQASDSHFHSIVGKRSRARRRRLQRRDQSGPKNSRMHRSHPAHDVKRCSFNGLYESGIRSRGTQGNGKGVGDFTASIHADSKNNFAYYNRGNVYLDLRKPKQAKADFAKALEIAPDMSPALLNRALANEYLANGSQHCHFRAALALEPTLFAASEGLKRLGVTPPGWAERCT